MKFTDIFIKRPVLAIVINLLILMVGVRALNLLEVRQYPKLEDAVVKVTTAYPGASSELVKGYVTTPLQQAIAEAEGIDYLFSTSAEGLSTIEVHMRLNYDSKAAVAGVQAKVASQRSVLPTNVEDPVIDATTGDSTALMYVAFYGSDLSRSKVTDFIIRAVKPSLQALPGVAKVRMFGQELALRIWLDPIKMAGLQVTGDDIAKALRENNVLSGVGETKGKYISIDLSANTHITDPKLFEKLIVRTVLDEKSPSLVTKVVRLEDVASVELGSENYSSSAWYNGTPAVFVGIEPAPGANPLEVAQKVNAAIPGIRSGLPNGLQVIVPYDASRFIQDSITEVYRTLAEALLIVLLVVFVCLGSLRAALVPAVAVPLSLIGGAFIMYLLGYSLNLLTLLSMVLAIGLVVDDAIVIVENVHRYIESGLSKYEAALKGARELAVPIIAMTTTLLAVYAPIGFMGGLVGSLFSEFAFSLAGAVLISGVVALTLSPMLSAVVLKLPGNESAFERMVHRFFNWLTYHYARLLTASLKMVPAMIIIALILFASIYFMFMTSRKELAPVEDQSILFVQALGPRTATLDYHEAYAAQIKTIYEQFPEYKESFYLLGGADGSTVFTGFKMKAVDDRARSQMTVLPMLQGALSQVAGYQTIVFPRPSLPGASGSLPVQFVITTDRSHEELDEVASLLVERAMKSGQFMMLFKSIQLDRPVTEIKVDREKAADLGISMEEISKNLSSMMGGNAVNRFSMEGRSYKVIPQVDRAFRLTEQSLSDYFIKTKTGHMVPFSSLISFDRTVEPSQRTQFQQLNSITLTGVMAPRVALGDALTFLEKEAADIFPAGYHFDYLGESRQFAGQGNALIITFFFSLLIIYLVLAAQFESWRDPLIILISVPLSIAGAMSFITLGFSSINIYTQVGLITLIGVVAKNGILIVEFANECRKSGALSRHEAVIKAASIRLRPIIMTSVSLIVAMIPLLFAKGPGAVSRFDIGLTIASGLGLGTVLTLFILPAFYVVLSSSKLHENKV